MQTGKTQLKLKKPIILALATVLASMIVANLIGKDMAILVGNLAYIPVTLALTSLTAILAIKFRGKSQHGIAWLMFLVCVSSWMIAEYVWTAEELVYHVNPFPSKADIFYVTGYFFLILFSLYYMKMAKDSVTKKMLLVSVVISASLLVPSIYMAQYSNSDVHGIAFALALAYPILDAIVLVPAVIGIMLFLKGEASKLWLLFSLAIISLVAGDTGFLLTQMNDTYYSGHPVEIMLIWSYILFSFGVYSQIKMFESGKNIFHNKESLR